MNCDTCEKLRVDASEDPGMHEHMRECASCQSFSQAVLSMDRELPQLWTPALPADFAGPGRNPGQSEGRLAA